MIFWTAIAGTAIIVILSVLRPLLGGKPVPRSEPAPEIGVYKDQLAGLEQDVVRGVMSESEAEAARTEIARRLLAAAEAPERERTVSAFSGGLGAASIGLVAAAVSLGAYALVGSPHLPDRPKAGQTVRTDGEAGLPSLVAQVEKRLEKSPNDLRGWSVLAPAYMRLRRFDDAADAFRRAVSLSPEDAELQTGLGEAVTMAGAGLVSAEAHEAFEKALEIDPGQAKARFYLGVAAFQDGRREDAVRRWKELLAEAPTDAPWRETVLSHIRRAEGAGVGAPALDEETVAAAERMSGVDRREMILGMVDRLADRLAEDGGDLDGWLRLMKARSVLGRRDEALEALADARAAFEGDAEALGRLKAFAAQLGLETDR